jgi:transcriptional regulator with XRE-family HTH domain
MTINKLPFFSIRIKNEMNEQNLTQSELSGVSGITQSTISNVLRGNQIKTSTLEKIALSLNLNPEYLLKEECLQRKIELDISKYKICSNIVLKVIESEKIRVDSDKIKFFQDLLYKAIKYDNIPHDHGESFVLGVIRYGLHIGTLFSIDK